MNWHRSESTWLLELFEALAASGAPWPEGAAMQWLRYASDQARDGKKAWSPMGQLKGIPGRPTLRRMWGEKAWSDRRVKNLLKLKTTTRHGVQIPAWEDPFPHERAYEAAQKRKKAQEEAEAELYERAQELADKQARENAQALEQERAANAALEARLAALEARLEASARPEAARMRPAGGQDAARMRGASVENHEGVGQDAARERPESVHARLPLQTETGPVSPPKAPQAAGAGEPHPPAPARGAGEPDPERAGVLLSEIRGAEQRTVEGLAEQGVLTVDDLDRVFPCLVNRPKRPGRAAIDRLRDAIADDRGWDSRVPEWREQARDLRAAASRAEDPAQRLELLTQSEELFHLVVRSCAVDERRRKLEEGFRAELAEVRSRREALAQGTPEQRARKLLETSKEPPWSYMDGAHGSDFKPWGRNLSAAEEETHRVLWGMGWEVYKTKQAEREAQQAREESQRQAYLDAVAGPPPVEVYSDCDDEPREWASDTRLRDLPGISGPGARALEGRGLFTVADWRTKGAKAESLGWTFDQVVQVLGTPGRAEPRERGEPIQPYLSVIRALLDASESGLEAEFTDAEERRIAEAAVKAIGGPQALTSLNTEEVPTLAWRLFSKLNPGQPGGPHATT